MIMPGSRSQLKIRENMTARSKVLRRAHREGRGYLSLEEKLLSSKRVGRTRARKALESSLNGCKMRSWSQNGLFACLGHRSRERVDAEQRTVVSGPHLLLSSWFCLKLVTLKTGQDEDHCWREWVRKEWVSGAFQMG